MPTAYVLINSDLGTDATIITKIKEILAGKNDAQYEIQGVYGAVSYTHLTLPTKA